MKFKQNLKRILGVSAAVAMLATTTSVMTAFAADATPAPYNLMPSADMISGDNASVTAKDGAIDIVATDATTLSYDFNGSYNIDELRNLYLDLDVTGANWGMNFNTRGGPDGDQGLTVRLQGDFGGSEGVFAGALETTGIIPGEYQNIEVGFFGSPNWNFGWNQVVPAGSETYYVDSVEIVFWGAGTMTLRSLYMGAAVGAPTNPTESTSDTTASTASGATTAKTEASESTNASETESTAATTTTQAPVPVKHPVSLNDADWSTKNEGEMVIATADGALELSNTNGQWPCAGIDMSENGITFDPSNATLYYDFTNAPDTNINLFFNGDTPFAFTENGGKYLSINPYIEGANLNESKDIVGEGKTYTGKIDLSKVEFADAAYNEDGTVTLTGVNVFAAGTAGAKVVIRELAIETMDYVTDPSNPTGTTASEDDTATTAADTTAATTTKAASSNPKTGDNTALVMAGAVLLVASVGALVVTGKKKSR